MCLVCETLSSIYFNFVISPWRVDGWVLRFRKRSAFLALKNRKGLMDSRFSVMRIPAAAHINRAPY